jgi:hypothetical protein
MGQMHNTGQAVNRTFDICRVHSGKRMGMPPARRRSSNRREVFTNRIRKEANHTQIRIEGRTRHLAGHVVSSRSHNLLRANEPGENAGFICLDRAGVLPRRYGSVSGNAEKHALADLYRISDTPRSRPKVTAVMPAHPPSQSVLGAVSLNIG